MLAERSTQHETINGAAILQQITLLQVSSSSVSSFSGILVFILSVLNTNSSLRSQVNENRGNICQETPSFTTIWLTPIYFVLLMHSPSNICQYLLFAWANGLLSVHFVEHCAVPIYFDEKYSVPIIIIL
jgi:hypothetical protein